jgi:multicomponent Na+:H+ antiporter subunit B
MITTVLFVCWIITALVILKEKRLIMMMIFFGIFSLISAACYLLLHSPDVAMAEAAASAFTTIFFVVCMEKYFKYKSTGQTEKNEKSKSGAGKFLSVVSALAVTSGLAFLYLYFSPTAEVNTLLRDQYISRFSGDVGGLNAVTAIYLGYRVYDTLFEALILVVCVVATTHLSVFTQSVVEEGKHSEVERSGVAVFSIRVICPLILMFGIYLVINGNISPGGGFQGGLAVASFFICRYMVYNIYDLSIRKINRLGEMVFISIALFAIFVVFQGAYNLLPAAYIPVFQDIYLVAMNVLIGLKVACGFIILFYRYIAVERREEV